MAENLNIGNRIDGVVDMIDNSTIERYCYDDLESNCDTYGGLYQWDEMMQYTTVEGVQGICPLDWHLPTDEEWKQLEGEVDSQFSYPDPEWDNTGARGFDVGLNLKSTSGWEFSGNGTDLYGFTCLPAGMRSTNGVFISIGTFSILWMSSNYNSSHAWLRQLSAIIDNIYRYNDSKNFGNSVRCVKD